MSIKKTESTLKMSKATTTSPTIKLINPASIKGAMCGALKAFKKEA